VEKVAAAITAPRAELDVVRGRIADAARLPTVVSRSFRSGLAALEIASPAARAAEVVVRGNLIYGDVSFYGRQAPRNLGGSDLHLLFRNQLRAGMELGGALGTVHFTGNHAGRLRVSRDILANVDAYVSGADSLVLIYRSFLADDNVFDSGEDTHPSASPIVIARHVLLTGHHFTYDAGDGSAIILRPFCQTLSSASNIGELHNGKQDSVILTSALRQGEARNIDLVVGP